MNKIRFLVFLFLMFALVPNLYADPINPKLHLYFNGRSIQSSTGESIVSGADLGRNLSVNINGSTEIQIDCNSAYFNFASITIKFSNESDAMLFKNEILKPQGEYSISVRFSDEFDMNKLTEKHPDRSFYSYNSFSSEDKAISIRNDKTDKSLTLPEFISSLKK